MTNVRIRKVEAEDFDAVRCLLMEAKLPLAGVEDHFKNFFVAESNGAIIGSIGLEVYGSTALLRSAAVRPSWQNRGVGSLLYETLLRYARVQGVRRLILLTNSAEKYFARKGFTAIPQDSVTGPITASAEFSGVCKHAVCMALTIGDGA